MMGRDLPLLGAALVGSAAVTVVLTRALVPLLLSHAVVTPNSRSSHSQPTPQGGGAAVVLSALAAGWCAIAAAGPADGDLTVLAVMTVACAGLALVGAIDDLRGLAPLPRLALQALAVGAVVASLPDTPLLPAIPWWLERALVFVAGVWFVNLVNFMDGIDWMTVAEVVPVAAALVLAGWIDGGPSSTALMAAALLGAMLGFAPFNKPVAKLFLGDVGSLPIGLLLGGLLLLLAGRGHLAAAALLPLYYLADATWTLGRRLWRRERVWQAHRSHFYQRAAAGALGVAGVIRRVFAVNLGLAALALLSVTAGNLWVSATTLAAGIALVAGLLVRFSRADLRP